MRLVTLAALAARIGAPPLAPPAAPAGPRPFTARDLNMLDRVSDPRLSPDGERVLYALRSTSWANNRGRNALWLVDADGGTRTRLAASQEGASSGRWARDGSIYFLSSR